MTIAGKASNVAAADAAMVAALHADMKEVSVHMHNTYQDVPVMLWVGRVLIHTCPEVLFYGEVREVGGFWWIVDI